MITENILRTWYAENAVRKHPVHEDASALDDDGKYLPDGLIVGMELSVPSTMSSVSGGLPSIVTNYHPHLGRVIITATEVRVDIEAGEAGVVATATALVRDIPDYLGSRAFPLVPVANDNTDVEGVGGFIVFGPPESFLEASGEYVFSYNSTTNSSNSSLSLECVHVYPESVRSINVGNNRLTGDIILEEGENTEISVDPVTNTITIGFPEDLVDGITDREGLIQALTDVFGEPICRINGVTPGDDGDFSLSVMENGCVRIEQQGHGLVLSNPCATPCCDKSSLEAILANIQTLNSRYGRLYSYLTETSNILNNMQNELSVLKMSLNYK